MSSKNQSDVGMELKSSESLQGNQGQYLTFILAEEEYGVNILSVVEIRGWEPVTPIPSAPDFVKGVFNLRGNIIPVVDLRKRFGLEEIEYTPLTVCVVLQIQKEELCKTVGIIVDAVSDVYTVDRSKIQLKPEICTTRDDYIDGLVMISQDSQENKLLIILDINKLLKIEELAVDAFVPT